MPPSDIYEESGCRLPLPEREALDDIGKEIYDHHVDPRGDSLAGLRGPGGIRLHSPPVSRHTRALNRYLRFEAGFGGAVRELIILMAARGMDSRFEWAAHEPEALRQGLAPEVIDVVKHHKSTDGLPETEAAVIEFGRELFRDRRVSAETYARAFKLFGARGLVDMVSLMGSYASTALLLVAFDVQLPDDAAPLPVP